MLQNLLFMDFDIRIVFYPLEQLCHHSPSVFRRLGFSHQRLSFLLANHSWRSHILDTGSLVYCHYLEPNAFGDNVLRSTAMTVPQR